MITAIITRRAPFNSTPFHQWLIQTRDANKKTNSWMWCNQQIDAGWSGRNRWQCSIPVEIEFHFIQLRLLKVEEEEQEEKLEAASWTVYEYGISFDLIYSFAC